MSSSTSSPCRTSRTSLPVARGDLAHQLREARHHAPYRDHRQPHRTVAHRADLGLGVLQPSAQVAGRGLQAVAEGDQGVHVAGDLVAALAAVQHGLAQHAAPLRVLGGDRRQPADHALQPAQLELGLPDDVEQVVHAPGRHSYGVARAGPCDSAASAASPTSSTSGDCGPQPRDLDRVLAVQRAVQRGDQGRQVVRRHRAVGSGHGPTDPLGRGQQQVDQVAADAGTGRPAALRAGPRSGGRG